MINEVNDKKVTHMLYGMWVDIDVTLINLHLDY